MLPPSLAKRERRVVVEFRIHLLDRQVEHHLAQHARYELRHVARLTLAVHDNALGIL
jgi:hypothetical protein